MLSQPLNILTFYDAEEFLTGSEAAIQTTARYFGVPVSTLLSMLTDRDRPQRTFCVAERQEAE